MLKKFGMVTVGVTAGLLAVAPMASATEDHDDHSSEISFGDDEGNFNNECASTAGDIQNDAEGSGLVGLGQAAGPVLSGSNANILNCTNILNDVLNDNDVSVAILGDALSGI